MVPTITIMVINAIKIVRKYQGWQRQWGQWWRQWLQW